MKLLIHCIYEILAEIETLIPGKYSRDFQVTYKNTHRKEKIKRWKTIPGVAG